MKLISLLLYIYLLLRPYYFFSSGGLQISDTFIIIAFIFYLILNKNKRKKIFNIKNENKFFVIFIILTCVVNGIYFLIYNDFKFILSSLYYIFILMALVLFSYSFKNNKKFMKIADKIFKFNLLIQFIIYISGMGRYYSLSRYMGTFNDPNQFGYYILLIFAFISIFNVKLNNKNYEKFIYFVISIILIFASGSTGMLLGITVMVILEVLKVIKYIYRYINKGLASLVFLIPIILIFFSIYNINLTDIKNINIINRTYQKINKFSNEPFSNSDYQNMNIFEERGYDKLYLYPQYLLYGSGEGYYERFTLSAYSNEIHATLPSIWFYYGVIPLLFLLNWMYKKLHNLSVDIKIIYFALILESFTLLNQRQVLFWIIIVLGEHFRKTNNKNFRK